MANSKVVVTKTPVTTYKENKKIMLELSLDEALVIRLLVGRVGGRNNVYKEAGSNIYSALSNNLESVTDKPLHMVSKELFSVCDIEWADNAPKPEDVARIIDG